MSDPIRDSFIYVDKWDSEDPEDWETGLAGDLHLAYYNGGYEVDIERVITLVRSIAARAWDEGAQAYYDWEPVTHKRPPNPYESEADAD